MEVEMSIRLFVYGHSRQQIIQLQSYAGHRTRECSIGRNIWINDFAIETGVGDSTSSAVIEMTTYIDTLSA
jgi:hypothetical protein